MLVLTAERRQASSRPCLRCGEQAIGEEGAYSGERARQEWSVLLRELRLASARPGSRTYGVREHRPALSLRVARSRPESHCHGGIVPPTRPVLVAGRADSR